MDTGNDPESPDHIPAFAILEPGTSAPQTVPSTAPPRPGAPSSSAAPSVPLNPRSCVTCRRRKVRCDKRMPCSNCRRNHIQCIFPAPGRAPRRQRLRPSEAGPGAPAGATRDNSRRESELLERLRKLEGIVEELSGQIEVERQASASASSPETAQEATVGQHGGPATMGHGYIGPFRSGGAILMGDKHDTGVPMSTRAHPAPSYEANASLYKQFGRLVINKGKGQYNKGKGRYISSAFWSRVKDELDDVRTGVASLSDDPDYSSDENLPEPPKAQPPDTYSDDAFIFGYRSSSLDLASFHPGPAHMLRLWQVYQDNVEPIVKMIHVPSIDRLIRDLSNGVVTLNPPDEALVFSIYYAAIVSLEDEETEVEFGSPKAPLLARYRFALEQGMARTNMLADLDFTVLTALVLFLTVVRRHDNTRFCWTTTGLAIRMAQGLGLHRDGTHFKLPPFEVEMRRRVWWALCSLDMRCAEEAGTDLIIVNRTFDTEFPSNINDADICPDSPPSDHHPPHHHHHHHSSPPSPSSTSTAVGSSPAAPPPGREGLTDTAIALVRHETLALCRRLFALATASGSVCPKDAASSMAERERMLVEVYERVETAFLRHLTSSSSPISAMIAMVARIIMAKSSLIIYQPMLFPGAGGPDDLSPEIKERLFVSAVEIVEYVRRLNVDPRFVKWRWLLQTYTHWHAVAYILLEMSRREWTPMLERAWAHLNGSLGEGPLLQLARTSDHLAVWMPLRRLVIKARRHRAAEIDRLRASPSDVRRIDAEDRRKQTRPSFGHVPGVEVDQADVRCQWLALVTPRPPATAASAPRADGDGHNVGQRLTNGQGQGQGEMQPGTRYVDDLVFGPFDSTIFFRGVAGLSPDEFGGSGTLEGSSLDAATGGSSGMGATSASSGMGGEETTTPPFLWPSAWEPDGKGPMGLGSTSGQGMGMGMGLGMGPPMGLEGDGSMSLDDGFSWDTWQESVRDLAGTSTRNSGWVL